MVSDRTPQTDSNGSDRALPPNRSTEKGGSRHERGGRERIERRTVLKLLGAASIPFAAGTASATSTGYGEGGYGSTAYGGGDQETTDSGDDESTLENTLLLEGVGTSGENRYEFAVSGSVEKSTYKGASINESDVVDGGRVTGELGGWRDAYRFSGELETLTIDGQIQAYVNDERIDPAEYGQVEPHVVTVVGNGVPSRYELAVDGSLEVLEGDDAALVSDDSGEGTIERDVHRYRFTGTLVDFTFLEGGTQVYLDQQRIDPDDYDGETRRLPHAIVFDGSDAADASSYRFSVDGSVTAATYRGATIDDSDVIDGTNVDGEVAVGAVDAYRFEGDIDDFRLLGEAEVDLEYDVDS